MDCKHFFSEIRWQIEVTFYMEHVLEVDNLNMTIPLLFMSPYQNVFHAMFLKTIKKYSSLKLF